jgi:hypothetical protein
MKKPFQQVGNYNTHMTAFNTLYGAVILNNLNNDISVVIPDKDLYYGMYDLTLALNEIGWDWSQE